MRSLVVLSVALLSTPVISAAQASNADAMTKLSALANATRLEDPALKPWHIKVSFDQKATGDHPPDSGTIEEWWASPEQHRITVNSALYGGSVTRDGATLASTTGVDRVPYLDIDLLSLFTRPLPSAARLGKSSPRLVTRPAGRAELDCVVLGYSDPRIPMPPFGTLPTFCGLLGSPGLAVLYRWRDEAVVIKRQGKFQGKVIPTELEVSDSAQVMVTAHLDALTTFQPGPSEFKPDATQTPLNELTSGSADEGAAKLVKKAAPVYPESARRDSISGTVVLAAVIMEDGHVDGITVVHSPDPALSKAAIAALKRWEYAPETVNGRPVQVSTVVELNFNIGR